jgi:NitT/TauT family transport system ATP-binding protein
MTTLTTTTEIVRVEGLRKTFPTRGGGALPVLDGIDLTVQDGEIVALLGKSGSGKSTLLRCIAGLVAPSAGAVSYRGTPLRSTNPGAALVFQTFALLPWLTVQENVELGLEARGVHRGERAARALAAIDRIGLDGFESAYPKELSGGMRQRVGFARALVVEPDLLMMDEPFSALDVLTAENLRTELLELWQAGTFPTRAILMVTHNIEEAVQFADRVVVLGSDPGRVREQIAVELDRPRDRHAPGFEMLVDQIYRIMTDRGPGAPSPARRAGSPPRQAADLGAVRLTHASVDGLSGLVEIVAASDADFINLAELASDLGLAVDDLLGLVDAAALLGFIQVSAGRVALTESGAGFAAAGIQDSKAMFGAAALAHVPLVRVIHAALQRSERGVLREGFFVDLLRRHFSAGESRAQLETAIDWGRYAELFEYDADRGELMLDADSIASRNS